MVPVKATVPPRPEIGQAYQKLLMATPLETQKEAIRHEWDWQGWADKMEDRTK
jgi:hypothetical protein